MKLHYFFITTILIPSITHAAQHIAQHIDGTATYIRFNKIKKPLYDWIRDDLDKEFGKTDIIKTETNEPPFTSIGTVKNLCRENFQLITIGYSLYCPNIKKENNIEYGAIVITPNFYHFDQKIADNICMHIKNGYLMKLLPTKLEEVTLESDESNETVENNATNGSTKRKKSGSKKLSIQ
jgi:hypothetical protein